MPEVRQRKLADPEKPVRASEPLHVEVVAVIERRRQVLLFKLVRNDPVVDPRDPDEGIPAPVEQPPAVHDDVVEVDRAHTPQRLGDFEVGTRLLRLRSNFHQDHFGPLVQMSNVRLEELLRVEIYRRGLHSDAFEHENLRPKGPMAVQEKAV